MNKMIDIDPLSTHSLRIQLLSKKNPLGTATAFVVMVKKVPFLITNWHVVAGRDANTNQPLSPTGAVPDTMQILHHCSARLGEWVIRTEILVTEAGEPKWIEHPEGCNIDVIALPLSTLADVRIYPFDLALIDADIVPEPAMPVAIIGYPFGLATGAAFPIWKTGHIASDPDVDYEGKPAFLIDATTKAGMSGSPVVLRSSGVFRTSSGQYAMSSTGTRTKFLGIYSGRIHEQSEIGLVWRPSVLHAILSRASGT